MATIPVVVKHQGKRHEVDLDPSSTGEVFKFQLYSITGVEPERQKILVKGGQLKDDVELSTLAVKPGHVFMMMGTPSGNVIQAPKEKTRFVEDMTEAEAAKIDGAIPAGLQNLGNTCYMNSTLQALRSVPELQEELARYKPAPTAAGSSFASSSAGALGGFGDLAQLGLGGLGASMDLTASLRDLYQQMSDTQDGFPPLMFLNAFRTAFPQFAQKSKSNNGYAQQDAEEAWSQILSQLRQKLKVRGESGAEDTSSQGASDVSFVDKYLAGTFSTSLECDETAAKEAGEEATKSEDVFLKLDCHINAQVNHLRDGILAALSEKIEKRSPALERDAIYTKTSRISRLPKYLTVHFVRFFWKREAEKKAKIMRKVTFPRELDVVEFCTDDLKAKLIPVREKIRDLRKDEEDIERARKRQKRARVLEQERKEDEAKGLNVPDADKKKDPTKAGKDAKAGKSKDGSKGGDVEMADAEFKTDEQIEAEKIASIAAAKRELLTLVDPGLAADDGVNKCGLYELRGVVAHQGASADSGHYTSYIKKQGIKDPKTGKTGEEDGKWWWFNDEKVSEVDADKIDALAGGGESHSALILLYRAIPIPKEEDLQ